MTKVENRSALRRNATHGRLGKPMNLRADHPAIVDATSVFPRRVIVPDFSSNLLKSGFNNRKIGGKVMKGMWAGMPIYALTLEERATCPTICEHWHDCYGNHMQWPARWKAGAELERILPGQIADLAAKHPKGFVMRLHVLGDFYSRRYVMLWRELMLHHKKLHVFGYTRREKDSLEGEVIDGLNEMYPGRWRIRWSGRPGEMGTSVTSDVTVRGRIPAGIVCPAQTHESECCSTCALCWNFSEPIVFINH